MEVLHDGFADEGHGVAAGQRTLPAEQTVYRIEQNLTNGPGPSILEFHPGRSCPLRCSFCYRQGRTYQENGPELPASRYAEVLHEFHDLGGQEVYISGGLEPLASPLIAGTIIRCAKRLRLSVRIYTNGVSRAISSNGLVEDLLECDQVRFSVPAISERTYLDIARPVHPEVGLQTVIDNVRYLLSMRDEADAGVRIGVSFLVLERNADELVPALLFWREMAVDFLNIRVDVCEPQRSPVVEGAIAAARRGLAEGRYEPLAVDLPIIGAKPAPYAGLCYAPLAKLVVDPFGLVFPCCLLAYPGRRLLGVQVGDLRRQSFGEVVRGVRKRVPFAHCPTCSPFEAEFNRRWAGRH